MSAIKPSSASFTQTPVVMCKTETRIMPSRISLWRRNVLRLTLDDRMHKKITRRAK